MLLLLGFLGLAGVGGGVYYHRRRKQAAAQGGATPPSSGDQQATDHAGAEKKTQKPNEGAAPPKNDNAGAAGAAAVVGALVGAELQKDYFDPGGKHPATDAAAPLIGGAIAFAVVLETGPQAVVVVPVIVIIAEALAIANIIEDSIRRARFEELQAKAQSLLDAGQGLAAAQVATDAFANEGFAGVGAAFDPHNLYDATSVTVETKDGERHELPVMDTLDKLYAPAIAVIAAAPRYTAPDGHRYVDAGYRANPDYQKSKTLGDQWADAFTRAIPWLARGWLNLKEPPTYDATVAQKAVAKETATSSTSRVAAVRVALKKAVSAGTAPPPAQTPADTSVDVDVKKDRTGTSTKGGDTGGSTSRGYGL